MKFQFTHPGKGATQYKRLRCVGIPVSIHAPWEGCDSWVSLACTAGAVSIHAPWEGCDTLPATTAVILPLFQFTHPGKGATILRRVLSFMLFSFNSRTLGRVRLVLVYVHHRRSYVSIHAPWEGCDPTACVRCWRYGSFQFTHPGKGATLLVHVGLIRL